MRGGETPPLIGGGSGGAPADFFKIYVSENAFQTILKSVFPYSMTSVLSKVRHSKPQGGTPIFSYIHRPGLFLGVQNVEFRYFWGFKKNE